MGCSDAHYMLQQPNNYYADIFFKALAVLIERSILCLPLLG